MTEQMKKLEAVLNQLNNLYIDYRVKVNRHRYSNEEYMPIVITYIDREIWIYPDGIEYWKVTVGNRSIENTEEF